MLNFGFKNREEYANMSIREGDIMKKKTILIPLTLVLAASLASCKGNSGNENKTEGNTSHTHEYASTWSSDASGHWHAATCGDDAKSGFTSHTYGDWVTVKEATETTKGSKKRTCNVCGYEDIEDIDVIAHTHTYSTDWTFNETTHWHQSTCAHDLKSEEANHTIENGKCTVCGFLEGTQGINYALSEDGNSYYASKVDESTKLSGEIAVASIYNGKPVTAIGDYAFYGMEITGVQMSDNITSIGKSAFRGCSVLTNITISNKLESIGDAAFYMCEKLESITIPSSVKSIPYASFMHCYDLSTLVISNGVESIGEGAFYHCSKLTSVMLPDSVTKIDSDAFASCETLESVTLSNNLTYLGTNVFDDSDKIKYTEYEGSSYLGSSANPYIVLMSGNAKDKTAVTINSNCKILANDAFSDCMLLVNIVIPDSVVGIGVRAFDTCSNLSTVVLPNELAYIGTDAFRNCVALTYNEYGNACYLGSTNNQYLLLVKAKSTDNTEATINENNKFIHSNAFEDCEHITSVTIPNGVISIGEDAFKYCYALTRVTLSNTVTSIGYMAFYYCNNLTTLVIPTSVTSIGDYFIDGCSSMSNIYYQGTKEQWLLIPVGDEDTYQKVVINYYSETQPTDTENHYWHYVDGVVTAW